MLATSETLRAIPQEDRQTLETNILLNSKDYTRELGTETNTALLRNLSSSSNVQVIDERPTLWQFNWVEVAWPTGSTVCRKDGQALWFKTAVTDIHGSKDDVWMDERSALKLSTLANKDAFINTWEAGDQSFPIMASVKVVRTMDQLSGASQPANAEEKRAAKFGSLKQNSNPSTKPQPRHPWT